MPPSADRNDVVTDVLDNARGALDKSRDLLDCAPVPGLSAAVGVLVAILDQVKKMKSNADTVKSVSNEIEKLNDVIARVVDQVTNRVTRLGIKLEERPEMLKGFRDSDGWRERVKQLEKELEEMLQKARPCAEGPWYKRLFRSNRDEETLKAIRADLASALRRFQLAGDLSIETLTEQNLAIGEATYQEVKRIAAAQEVEAIKQDEERKRQEEERERSILEAIAHADAAGFKSVSNSDKSFYISGTREVVWKHLDRWVSSEKPVCFLIGAAGMGKSTIASEFCRRHEDELGASYFFRRGDPSVGSTTSFFSTIAYQLAHSRPALRSRIARAAQSHTQAGHYQQMQYVVADLLHKPLCDSEAAGELSPVYIVVDALDECNESASQPDLVPECLRLLLSCSLRYPSFLRLLITSRPEPDHIGEALQRDAVLTEASIRLSLHEVEKRQAIDRDIGELIHTRLCDVEEGAQWYHRDPSIVQQLTEQSQGVFVYARTAVDFVIRSAGIAQMERRLRLLLTPGNTYGLGSLDLLYRTVLETAFPPADLDPVTHQQVRLILAWIALCQERAGTKPSVIETLSGIPCLESVPILMKLRSVLHFGPWAHIDSKTGFRALHVTFRDFLVDRARCGDDYHVHASDMHARLAADCLRWMHYNRAVTGNWPSDVTNYAAVFWSDHVIQASPTDELVGLLRDIFTSISTDRPSLFFSYQCTDRILIRHHIDGATSLLRWMDMHIGREVAEIIAEQFHLTNYVTIVFGEKITVSSPSSFGSPGAPTEQEVNEWRDQNSRQWNHLKLCWARDFPGAHWPPLREGPRFPGPARDTPPRFSRTTVGRGLVRLKIDETNR